MIFISIVPCKVSANSSANECLLDGWRDERIEGRMDGLDGLRRNQQGTHYPWCHLSSSTAKKWNVLVITIF